MNRDPTSTIAEAGLVFFYVQVHADKKKENEQMWCSDEILHKIIKKRLVIILVA